MFLIIKVIIIGKIITIWAMIIAIGEYKKSQKFIEWLITGEGKDVINRFTYNGEKLFHTN